MTATLLGVIAGAMLLVRLGWSENGQPRRWLSLSGWAIAMLALGTLAVQDGAWGLAVGIVGGIVAALAIVLFAGWRSPARTRRAPREAPAVAIPRRWSDLLRRVTVFALVVPVAFAAAQWLALGAQALARRHGMGEADAIVLALFVQPVGWAILMAIQMTRASAARMVAPPALAAALGAILWGAA